MQPREHRLGREAAALALIAEIFRRQAVRDGAQAGDCTDSRTISITSRPP